MPSAPPAGEIVGSAVGAVLMSFHVAFTHIKNAKAQLVYYGLTKGQAHLNQRTWQYQHLSV